MLRRALDENEVMCVVTHDRDALWERLSQVVAQQASSSAALSKTMDEMSTVTQQTVVGTKQFATSLNHLTLLVGTLRRSVNKPRRAA